MVLWKLALALGCIALRTCALQPEDLWQTDLGQFDCAWQLRLTACHPNVQWNDHQAIYHLTFIPKIDDLHIVKVTGTFPRIRYFGLHTYDLGVQLPVAHMSDYAIKPDPGSLNPYVVRDDSNTNHTFTVYLTPRGDHGYPNEMAVCPRGYPECQIAPTLFSFSIVTSDPGAPEQNCFMDPPPNKPNPRQFGWTSPPAVEIRMSAGRNEKWRTVPTCKQDEPTALQSLLEAAQAIFQSSVLLYPYANHMNNFVGATDPVLTGSYALKEFTYFTAIANEAGLPLGMTGRLVAKLRVKLPMTAQRTVDGPHVTDYLDYDMRFFSMSILGLTPGMPVMDGFDDTKILRLSRGLANSTLGEDGYFSVFVGASKEPRHTCGLYDPTADLFLSTSLNGEPQRQWSVLTREVVSRFDRDGTPDTSGSYALSLCTKTGAASAPEDVVKACARPSTLQSTMHEFYPSIQFFTCDDATGALTPITTTLESTFR